MSKISAQAKSFIILIVIALVGTYVALMFWWLQVVKPPEGAYEGYRVYNYEHPYPRQTKAAQNPPSPVPAPIPSVDTSDWKTYSNSKYGLSFAYAPDWKVLPATEKNGFTVLQVDPGKKYYNFAIYISPSQFYLMDGLPTQEEIVCGFKALNVNNALYGIQANGKYYTFDIGISMTLVPQFDALVHSVKFQ